MSLSRKPSPIEVEASVAAINPGNNPLANLRDGWRNLRASHADILQVTGAICKDDWQTLKMDSQYAWHNAVIARRESDYNSKRRIVTAGLSAGLLVGIQPISILRLPTIVVPSLAMKLGETQEALTVGVTTAATLGSWNFFVGQVWDNAMRQHPKTVKGLGDRVSSLVKFSADSLPGVKPAAETKSNSKQAGKIRRLGRWGLMNFQRSIASIGIGIGAYAITANLSGQSWRDTFKLTTKCGYSSGALMGSVTGGLAWGIDKISEDHPGGAELIQSVAESPYTWTGVAAIMVLGQAAWKKQQDKASEVESAQQLNYSQFLTSSPEPNSGTN